MIRLEQLSARAGDFVLQQLSVTVPRGAWAIVLGPAGAGKTTLLETIAGVRPSTGGRLLLRGHDATRVAAESRGTAIVYQRGFLFPHLSVSANIGYGARDAAYTAAVSARFGADVLAHKPVRSLSGGERQVVALVRALAPRPDILLLDEPFAALDPRGRSRVRRELQALQREQGITVMQVTHDFSEAGTLGDLALLMEGGRLVQADTPAALFRHPATSAAAEFLGAENIYAGTVARREQGSGDGPDTLEFDAGAFSLLAVGSMAAGPGHAVIRGEDVTLSPHDDPSRGSARNVLQGTVTELVAMGVVTHVTLAVGTAPLVAVVTTSAATELGLHRGGQVTASVKATAVHLC